MNLYSLLKLVHILSAMVFLGTGFGTAYFKYRADRCGDLRVVAWMQRETVRADYLLTIPAGVLLPLSGGLIVHVVKFGWTSSWVMFGIAGYAVAGLCWLPAAWLQIRMRALANEAIAQERELAPEFFRYARYWTILGFPSFLAAVVTVWVMIAKYAAWTLPQ